VVGTLGFSLQIYFDFSAYSDIAIGSARLFGFKFPENFQWPYLARSPQEFWERWHMTLSRWIRDYVFTPMAFAQRGRPRMQRLALVSAMAICGLWHGARWTFVLWGVWHGLLLVANQTVMKTFFSRSAEGTGVRFLRTWLTTGLTVSLVAVGWILFRAQDLKQAATMASALATGRGGIRPMLVRENGVLIVLIIFMAVLGAHVVKAAVPKQLELMRRSTWARFLTPAVHALSILAIVIFDKEAKAFVYFQF
jgi:alginate O-acetyltransferase complex protein AlgI